MSGDDPIPPANSHRGLVTGDPDLESKKLPDRLLNEIVNDKAAWASRF